MAPSRTSAPWNWRAWCCAKTRERCMASKLRALTAGSFRPPPPSGGSSGKYVGNWRASALGLSEEAVELAAGGVEGALLVFPAVVDQRSAVLVDHIADKLFRSDLSQRRVFVHVADDLSAENPEVVDVSLDGLFRQV